MKRLPDRLREAIEEEIATGRLPPGTRLDEVELATRFGVSRTPIREALSLLLGEGLIEARPAPSRGAVVAQASPERLCEMFEVMAELEAMCVRLAARRMSPVEEKALRAAHEACRKAARTGDSDAYFYANEHFHFALYAACRNRFLADEATALQRRLRPYRRLQLRVRGRVPRSFAEHEAVIDALARGDGEAAVRAIRDHVLVQGERFTDLVASIARFDGDAAAASRDDAPARPRAPVRRAPAKKARTATRAPRRSAGRAGKSP